MPLEHAETGRNVVVDIFYSAVLVLSLVFGITIIPLTVNLVQVCGQILCSICDGFRIVL